jgi:HAD superfamily hydrolase (TIGR01490 family)
MKKRKFAVFDIDGTLYRSSLFLDTVEKLIHDGVISSQRAEAHFELKRKWEERAHKESYEEFIYDVVVNTQSGLKDLPVTEVERASHEVAQSNKDLVYTYTRDLIKQLKSEGYFVMAISGSHSEVAERFCQLHGFDAFSSTIWLRSEDNKSYTGEVVDMGRDKAKQLESMVEQYELDFGSSYGVGDSRGDITMLKLVDHPIAFNPEQHLLDEAKANQWQVVIERKNVVYKLEASNGHFILA